MMPTPQKLRYVSSELAIELLTRMSRSDAVAKQLARWFPDATQEEMVALRELTGQHLEHYAILLRERSTKLLATGMMVQARLPQ